jgi:hypothetical protein
MNVIKTAIDGVVIIEPRLFKDDRGYFFESFSERDFNAQVRTVRFVQDNESKSSYGVLRGLHFQKPPFAQIARSDGNVCAAEIDALKEVAQSMQLSAKEVESMLNLSGNSLEEAYKVLEVEPTATDDEVRAAYRRLALKHHPDRVATLGEDIRKAAEEKFQSINNAKERIYKARGMK